MGGECLGAIPEAVVKMGLKRLPVMPSRQFPMLAKALVCKAATET